MKRLAAVLAALALAVTACTTKEELKKHNEEDVTFVQTMLPLQEQAIHMSELAKEHANSPDVEELASVIKTKQEEEKKAMEKLLHEWGLKEEGGHGAQHLLSPQELAELEHAEGVEFDKCFLRLMIKHHEEGAHLAEEAEHKAENEEVKKLAAEIRRGQEHEIEEMEKELVGL